MKNSLLKSLYHFFVIKYHGELPFRGGWMLTQLFVDDYKARKASFFKIAQAHLKGWSYNDWSILGITDKSKGNYLSTRDYCSLHPFNGIYSTWIDDKLTLKYLLYGTDAGVYMPAYYFQIENGGKILPLMDAEKEPKKGTVDDVIKLLQVKKRLAFKLIKGSLGEGFYKAYYNGGGKYLLNDQEYSKDEFRAKVENLSGYLVTELLLPHAEVAKYCNKSVGCLRYIIGRNNNQQLQDVYSFMRFGTAKSNFVENFNAGGVLVIVKDGLYNGGYVLDFENFKKHEVSAHPDNNIPLVGSIPLWQEVVKAAHIIAETLPQLSYMGIDFCLTDDNKVKIIEINSLSSLDSFQLDKSIFSTQGGTFFKEKLMNKN